MTKKALLILLVLLLTSCSQKTPTIDGQKNRFVNKFFPAQIDSLYAKGDISKQKFPIIFLFDGYEGVWDNNQHIRKLQKMGYHVASIGYFDDAGYSNNLSKVDIDGIKKVMDNYKKYYVVDTEAIGVLGRGKGAELALLLASYYPDIKMVVGISPSSVAFQSSRATLATNSSWVHEGKEVAFVPYPKLSWSAVKSVYRLIVQNDNYRDLHDLAIEDKEAVKKARIKVEDINGDILLLSVTEDKLWNSVLMGEEIVKRLKDKNFTHKYKHKSYKGKWFLRGEDAQKGWHDIYGFIGQSLTSKYTKDMFSSVDKDGDNALSFDEYLNYTKEKKKQEIKADAVRVLYQCDTNHNQKIDFSEARLDRVYTVPVYNEELEYTHTTNLPLVKSNCIIGQNDFKIDDLNSDRTIDIDEIVEYLNSIDKVTYSPLYNDRERYKKFDAERRLNQCDQNHDTQIDKKEANLSKCKIDAPVFTLADTNTNALLSLSELIAIPAKYVRFRTSLYASDMQINTNIGLVYSTIYECDTNHDSKLDKAEATTKSCGYTEQEFIKSDVTKDGFFSMKDIKLRLKIDDFNEADKNADKKLNLGEWVRVL